MDFLLNREEITIPVVAQRHIIISEVDSGDLVQCSGEVVHRSGKSSKVDSIASESLANIVGMSGQHRLESVANFVRKTHPVCRH
jgi:hypothetical protein